tara:strand:+ start:271 stop:1149 length:879 start_codon:yes stop_codon:yes gene_type:complete
MDDKKKKYIRNKLITEFNGAPKALKQSGKDYSGTNRFIYEESYKKFKVNTRKARKRYNRKVQNKAISKINKKEKEITGYTTFTEEHNHAYTILPNNKIIIHPSNHPKTNVLHTHTYNGNFPNGSVKKNTNIDLLPNSHVHNIDEENDGIVLDNIINNINKLSNFKRKKLNKHISVLEESIKKSNIEMNVNDKLFKNYFRHQLNNSYHINELSEIINEIGLPKSKSAIKLLLTLITNKKHEAIIENNLNDISVYTITSFLHQEVSDNKLAMVKVISIYLLSKILWVLTNYYKL